MSKNNDSFEYLVTELRKRTLAEGSRTRMRAELSSYADFHPLAATQPASRFGWLTPRRSGAAFAAALLVIALMGGSAYAAERALPGDPLYVVKRGVNEPVQLAFKATLEGKAEAHAEFAERRLEEAVQLAVTKGLDEDTEEYLEQEFSEQVDRSLARADELSAAGKNEASLKVRSRLEARLTAHADILDMLEERFEDTATDQSEIARELLEAVRLRQDVVSETRLALERDLEDEVTQTETLARVTKADADTSDERALRASTLTLPAQVARRLADAEEAISDAKESLEDDNQNQVARAFRKVGEAERSSEIAAILFEKKELLASLERATTSKATATTTATTTEAHATTSVEMDSANELIR